MEKIIKDWKENAAKKEDKNFVYIRSLKMKDSDKVDSIAQQLHEEAFSKIDCLQCGNCCKTIKPTLDQEDIEKIGTHLKMTSAEVKDQYLEEDEDNDWTFNALPCPFLSPDNSCQIYSSRPKSCREYPNTDKKDFASRSYQHSWNTVTCPATYYIVERMQKLIK